MTKPVTPFDGILASAQTATAAFSRKLPTYADPVWYRGFRIYYDRVPYVAGNDWSYVHDDYDGADDAHDNRAGTEASLEACKTEIDERFFDDDPDAYDKAQRVACQEIGR